MKKLKLAFIGGGLNSAVGATHKISSQMDDRFELVSGCFSKNKEINELTGKQWHTSRLYSNWRELLKVEKKVLDAVVILTPTSEHAQIVIEAIRSGYPVICEKSLTTSIADALKIKEALAHNKGYLAVTFNYTGYPMVRELRSIIAENRLGRIQQIHIEMPQEGYFRLGPDGQPVSPQKWRLQDGEIPILSLDLGGHLHNMIYFLTGESPQEVIAVQNSYGFFKQVVDNVICIAKYSNNITCNIWYGKTALGYRNGLRIRVYGEKGSAEWCQMDPEKLHLHDNTGHSQTIDRGSVGTNISSQLRYSRFKAGHPAGFIEAFANHYVDIADSLLAYQENQDHRSAYIFGVDEALEGLYMLRAADRSAKNMAWEKVVKEA